MALGPVAFRDFEVPSEIAFGGRQRLVVHRLIGGGRVVDAVGRDDGDLVISGTFTGSDATDRARTLDYLRSAGDVLFLTWDVFLYSVVISAFRADFSTNWWIPFSIKCTVVRDESSPLDLPTGSLTQAVVDDILAAQEVGSDTGIDFGEIQANVTNPTAMVPMSSAYGAAMMGLSAAGDVLSQQIAATESTILGLTSQDVTSVSSMVRCLGDTTNTLQHLCRLTLAQAKLGRARRSLGRQEVGH